MRLAAVCVLFLLSACGGPSGSTDSAGFPKRGDYSVTFKDPTGEKELADWPVNAPNAARLEEFVSDKLGLDRCEGGDLEIGGGKIEGRMSCKITDRSFPVEISGSYSPTSIDIISSTDSGSAGMFVEERRYRLKEKKAGI